MIMVGRLAADAGRYGEGVEIAAPKVWGRAEAVVSVEVIDQSFAHAGQLPEAFTVAGIADGQIEQLQSALDGFRAVFGTAAFAPVQRPPHLTAYVAHLFGEAEREPPAGRQSLVLERHRVTKPLNLK
jgi:hypothetical protein